MAGGSIKGVVGQIKWGYFTAAAINGYTVSRSPDNVWTLIGTVVIADGFQLMQRPLFFVAPHAKGEWRWPITSIDIGTTVGPSQIRATLGNPL